MASRLALPIRLLAVILLASLASLAAPSSPAQAETAGSPSATAPSSEVAIDELELRLLPLTKDDLSAELDAWIAALKAQASEISELQIQGLAAQAPAKDQIQLDLVIAKEKRARLIDRVRAVIAAFTAKGGDAAVQQKYVEAVSGIVARPSDAGGAITMAKSWLTSSEGGIRWLRNIALFFVTLFVFRLLADGLGAATNAALARSKSTSDLLKSFLVNVVRKLTRIVGLVVALSMLEINIGPLVAAIGATGFVVGFALQNTLSNFAAGIMLLLYRPFDIGDDVNVAGGTAGTVEELTLVSTSLITADGHRVVVPNSAIWGAVIVNESATPG